MKARPAVVCPACGALNRPTWEYCARCSGSLEGAKPSEAPAGAAERQGEVRASVLPARLVAVAAVIAFVVLGALAWRQLASAPAPSAADPGLFTFPTRPAEIPPAPAPTGPGAADFDAGRRLLVAGDAAGALPRLAAAVAANPSSTLYKELYAEALWKAGDRETALRERAAAARLDPQQQVQYARSLDVAGRSAEAVREYEAYLAANPGSDVARAELGRLLYRTGDYAKAAPYLQSAVQLRPTDPVVQQELGYALAQAGRQAEAASAYREALRLAPAATATRALLSESLVEQGRKDEALAVLQEGLTVSPNDADARASDGQRPGAIRPPRGGRGGVPDLREAGPERSRREGDRRTRRSARGGGEEAMNRPLVLSLGLLLAWPCLGAAQGLGDAAARERQKRAAQAASGKATPVRVLTDADLAEGRPPGPDLPPAPRRDPVRGPPEHRGAPFDRGGLRSPASSLSQCRHQRPGPRRAAGSPGPHAGREAQPHEHELHLRGHRQQQRERGGAGAGGAAAGRIRARRSPQDPGCRQPGPRGQPPGTRLGCGRTPY